MGKSPAGAVRLLQADDVTKPNVFGRSLVGWKSTSLGEGGLYNPRGLAMLRVVVQKWISELDTLGDLYDQPMLVENVGSIVVPLAQGKVGLVESYRLVGARIMQAEPNYVARLNDENHWEELFSKLGAWKWEAPRGMPPTKIKGKFDSDQELALAGANLEALQEAGFVLKNQTVVGRVNANPTFFAHSQYVIKGEVESQTAPMPEELETIGKVHFFAPHEVRGLVESFYLDDGLTKAALADAGFHY